MEMASTSSEDQWVDADLNSVIMVDNLKALVNRSARRVMSCPNGGEDALQIYRLQRNSSKLFRSSKYMEALDQLESLCTLQQNNLKTLMMITECIIFLDKFDEAFKFIKEALEPAILKAPLPNAKDLITESQICRQSEKLFRSLNYVWCACAVYQAQPTTSESLEGILECMHNMEELLVHAFEKYGTFENKDCSRFAEMHLRHLKQLGKMKKSDNPKNSALFANIRFRRIAGIASCYLLLQEFRKSIDCFQECVSFSADGDGVNINMLKFGPIGNFVARVASCFDSADEELQDISYHIIKARKDIAEYETANEYDVALKMDAYRFMEEYGDFIRKVEKGAQSLISNLLRLNFRR